MKIDISSIKTSCFFSLKIKLKIHSPKWKFDKNSVSTSEIPRDNTTPPNDNSTKQILFPTSKWNFTNTHLFPFKGAVTSCWLILDNSIIKNALPQNLVEPGGTEVYLHIMKYMFWWRKPGMKNSNLKKLTFMYGKKKSNFIPKEVFGCSIHN